MEPHPPVASRRVRLSAESAKVLQLLATGFIIMLVPPNWNPLLAVNLAHLAFYVNAIGAVLNGTLNWILIPRYGMLAGAWTSIATLVVVKLLWWIASRAERTLS